LEALRRKNSEKCPELYSYDHTLMKKHGRRRGGESKKEIGSHNTC